jgi:cysteine desulfurase
VRHLPIYFDNHATTRVDPRVVEAMLPYFGEMYGNPASSTHGFGREAQSAVEAAREILAEAIGARPAEIVFTSGATESNNLAISGAAEKHGERRHIVSVAIEHPSVLEPLARLARRGFEVTLLPVTAASAPHAGLVEVQRLAAALRDDTLLVSVMLANSEIGVIQPLAAIGRLCHERGVLVHCDATQAVGKIPVDVEALQVDMLSCSAHKLYGPKGVGALFVRSRGPRVRLEPLVVGGGQEHGLRSGTLNVPAIVGFARALELCLAEMATEQPRLAALRGRLFAGLCQHATGVTLNGPSLAEPALRLPGNLNVRFAGVDGQSLLLAMNDVAASSTSACASAAAEPSHVLRAIGLSDDEARGSIRFGLGRFNTVDEVEAVIGRCAAAVKRLRAMGE